MLKLKWFNTNSVHNKWFLLMCAVIVLTATLVTFQLYGSYTNFNNEVEATEDVAGMWATFPGVSITATNGVHFNAVDRKIVNQDGSGGIPDPAVNVGGSHLFTHGDFEINLSMSQLDNGDASFRLYRDIPVIYDEWRYDGTSVGFTLSGKKLTVDVWNGKNEDVASTKSYDVPAATQVAETKLTTQKSRRRNFYMRKLRVSQPVDKMTNEKTNDGNVVQNNIGTAHTITLQRTDKKLTILVDGKKITTLSASSLFSKDNLWFGADATGDGWTLDGMVLSGNASLRIVTASTAQTGPTNFGTLADQARPGFKVGAAISLYPLMTDPEYRNLALNQFNMWTTENSLKAQFVQPKKGTYTFEQADLLVDTAMKNKIAVHGHALVFGEANAAWMQSLPKNELKAVMEDHITTVMQHYAGKITEWDVINEPLADYDTPAGVMGLRKSIWYNAMGESFIADALTAARKADPNAKLYINEFGIEADGDGRWETFIKLLQKLQAAKVPLDGVGFQTHVYEAGDTITSNVLKSHMKQLASMGLLSRISEMDVRGDDAAEQAQQYQAGLSACLSEPSCTSFSTWGITDKYGSTTSNNTYPPEYGNDLLWDSKFQPKAAVGALLSGLK